MNDRYIYVVFSATSCAVGSFIRRMTHNTFNHVSVSLDSGLTKLYSFARYHENAPLYAGFVEESAMRYKGEQPAIIKVCRVAVDSNGYEAAVKLLENVEGDKEKYIYNFASAACFLLRHRVFIANAYTCIEFAVKVLSTAGVPFVGDEYYSIYDLEKKLSGDILYEGASDGYIRAESWGNDEFLSNVTRRRYAVSTLSILCRLAFRRFHVALRR